MTNQTQTPHEQLRELIRVHGDVLGYETIALMDHYSPLANRCAAAEARLGAAERMTEAVGRMIGHVTYDPNQPADTKVNPFAVVAVMRVYHDLKRKETP